MAETHPPHPSVAASSGDPSPARPDAAVSRDVPAGPSAGDAGRQADPPIAGGPARQRPDGGDAGPATSSDGPWGGIRTMLVRRLRHPVTSGRLLNIWATAIAAVVAVGALVLSLVTTVQLNSLPSVAVTAPSLIRLNFFADTGSAPTLRDYDIVVQPTLTTDRSSNRTAIISDYRLDITPPPGYRGPPLTAPIVAFDDSFTDDTGTQKLQYDTDPKPLAVTQDNPQAPLLAFELIKAPVLRGRWQFRLTLVETTGDEISMSACVDLSDFVVDDINKKDKGAVYKLFRSLVASINGVSSRQALDPSCYRS